MEGLTGLSLPYAQCAQSQTYAWTILLSKIQAHDKQLLDLTDKLSSRLDRPASIFWPPLATIALSNISATCKHALWFVFVYSDHEVTDAHIFTWPWGLPNGVYFCYMRSQLHDLNPVWARVSFDWTIPIRISAREFAFYSEERFLTWTTMPVRREPMFRSSKCQHLGLQSTQPGSYNYLGSGVSILGQTMVHRF